MSVLFAEHPAKGSFVVKIAEKLMKKRINIGTTQKAKELLTTSSKIEFSELLGITRPTLDKRLISHDWSKLEIAEIDRQYDRVVKRV